MLRSSKYNEYFEEPGYESMLNIKGNDREEPMVIFSSNSHSVPAYPQSLMFSDAATEVERVFRGHLGRIRARNALQDRTEARQICLFQYFAIQMQRSFRGYYSRKYKRNHASRKAYVRTVIDKNNQVLAMMENYANEQAQVTNALIEHHCILSFSRCNTRRPTTTTII